MANMYINWIYISISRKPNKTWKMLHMLTKILTVPTEGFSLFACVNSKPPGVCSSASATWYERSMKESVSSYSENRLLLGTH